MFVTVAVIAATDCIKTMGIYHATVKVFSRASGQSATAAAAYRAGTNITDTRTGVSHDYRKRQGVASAELFAPQGSPSWAYNAELLWNAAEAAERRSNACVARELEVSLPEELNAEQRNNLAHDLARLLVERYNVAVLAAVHEPSSGNDPRNFHVHLQFSTRVIGPDGFGAKVRILDARSTGPTELRALRAEVAQCINDSLKKAGKEQRVDHRTLEVQARDAARRGDLDAVAALSREPTKHLGRAANALARRGRASHRAREQDELLQSNAELLEQAQRRVRALRKEQSQRQSNAARTRRPSTPKVRRIPASGNRASRFLANSNKHSIHHLTDETTRMYLEELRETIRRIAEGTQQAMLSDEHIAAIAEWVASSKKNSAFLQRVQDAETVLRDANEQFMAARRRFGEACAQRGVADDALRVAEQNKPTVYNFLTRRQWVEKRRAQKALSEKAMQAERALWNDVREGGPLPVAVAVAKQSLMREWNALQAAEQESRTPLLVPIGTGGAERVPTPARRGGGGPRKRGQP